MSQRNFMDLLQARWAEGKFVCVGLDSDIQKLPVRHIKSRGSYSVDEMLIAQAAFAVLQRGEDLPEGLSYGDMAEILGDTILDFNEAIIDATKHLVCAYKPNSAFYEALGFSGLVALKDTIDYIHNVAPEVPVILDYKRGDIGNTNAGYVAAAQAADAVTVHPYLGMEAMKPFLDQMDKGVIVLVRTSNPGAGEFQDLRITEQGDPGKLYDYEEREVPLYQIVARNITRGWNYNGNCAVVVGATYPAELAEVRKIVGDMPILIPGIGAQGGELEASVRAGVNSHDQGMIINGSRGIIFASDGEDFAEAARSATSAMHNDISIVLAQI